MNDVLLDSNCDQQNCKLKLGVSQAFRLNSIKRNSRLNNNGKKFFESIFTSPNGKKLLHKCRISTLEQYQDVIQGKKKTLVTIPPQFTYDKRIKATTSIDEDAIEDRIKHKTGQIEKELRDIKAFRSVYLPQAGERDIYGPLLGCFFKHQGLFINGFEQNKYLDIFVELAEVFRRAEVSKCAKTKSKEWTETIVKDIPNHVSHTHKGWQLLEILSRKETSQIEFFSLQQSLKEFMKQNNCDTQQTLRNDMEKYFTLEDPDIKVRTFVKSMYESISPSYFQGKTIKASIDRVKDEYLSINTLSQAKRRFKDNRKYSKEEINAILFSCLKTCTQYEITGKPFAFHELEKNILECLGENVAQITERTENLLKSMKSQQTKSGVRREDITSAIENCEIGSRNFKNKAKSKFTKHNFYSEEDIKSFLMMSMYEDVVKLPGEWDFLIILGDRKIMLNVEVKKQLDVESRKKCNLNESLNSASRQTMEHANYASNVFSPLLSDGWNFIKIACILPGELDYEKICSHCRQFVIVGKNRAEIEQNISKLKSLLTKHFKSNIENDKEDFLNIFEAIVGFSSLSRTATGVFGKNNSWRQIQGANADVISLSSGWTQSNVDFDSADYTFKKIIDEPHNLNKLLYFNHEVIKIISNNLTRVILACDFGSGKTLILREGALRVMKRLRDDFNERLENDDNFKPESIIKSFMNSASIKEEIPVVVSSTDDKPRVPGLYDQLEDEEPSEEKRANYQKHKNLAQDSQNMGARGVPAEAYYLFDIKTEMELEPHGITFISAQDLALFYKKNKKDPQEIKEKEGVQETPYFTQDSNGQFVPTVVEHDGEPNIYTMAEIFIEEAEKVNPGGFYFFDEVPLIKDFSWYTKKSVDMAKKFIKNCISHVTSTSYIWIAFQSNVLFEKTWVSGDFNKCFGDMVEEFSSSCCFYSPKLNTNMRNTREISEFTNGVQKSSNTIIKKDFQDVSDSRDTSVTSRKPKIWPIKIERLETQLDATISAALDENEINVILYSNEENFNPFQIKESLIKYGIEENNILIHSLNSKNTKQDIKRFFKNPRAFLICLDEYFIGMEAYGIIFCHGDSDFQKSFRCHMLRATSELNVIYGVADNPIHMDFGASSLLSPDFLECDKVMTTWACKCRQCDDDMVICKSCLIACHNGHMKEFKNQFATSEYFVHIQSTFQKESMYCECNEKTNDCVLKCQKY